MKSKSAAGNSLFRINGVNYLAPFILVTSLFFLWGFAHSLLDVLNKHFQEILHVSKAKSGLVQAAVYGGYFLMAIPAGIFMKNYGYRKGIIFGLLLYATGAFLFLPAIQIQQFWAFLTALFIIALGLTCLETAANPYSSVLGPTETSEQRLTLSQSFNGLGWILGPLVGSVIIFAGNSGGNKFASLAIPYVTIGIVVLLVAVLFVKIKLPEVNEAEIEHVEYTEKEESSATVAYKSLFQYKHFVWAVIAQFCYVAVQTGINSFFINYVVDVFHTLSSKASIGNVLMQKIIQMISGMNPGIKEQEALFNTTAGIILSICGMGLFMTGRFLGSLFMTWFKPNKLLAVYAAICVLLTLNIILVGGFIAIISLCLIYFFMSIMFPTIFALGLKNLGSHTKRASSFLIMAIVGGAVCPVAMGAIADSFSMATGFVVPLIGFLVILYFGLKAYKTSNL